MKCYKCGLGWKILEHIHEFPDKYKFSHKKKYREIDNTKVIELMKCLEKSLSKLENKYTKLLEVN
jgi:hypothetical protein